MIDIREWLTACLNAEEAAALAAGASVWRYVHGEYGPRVDLDGGSWSRDDVNVQVWQCDDELDGCPDHARSMAAEGRHIARHDPARVLAEVAAKRRILELHPPANDPGQPPYCETCGYREDPDDPEPFPEAGYPCPTVRALAAPGCGCIDDTSPRCCLHRYPQRTGVHPGATNDDGEPLGQLIVEALVTWNREWVALVEQQGSRALGRGPAPGPWPLARREGRVKVSINASGREVSIECADTNVDPKVIAAETLAVWKETDGAPSGTEGPAYGFSGADGRVAGGQHLPNNASADGTQRR